MRVNYLQLSNILSFKYEENINNAFKIEFDPDLNIIIGENGSGKSTVLEAINFVFTRILFRHCEVDEYKFLLSAANRKDALEVDDPPNCTGSHPGNPGSIPGRVTKETTSLFGGVVSLAELTRSRVVAA